MIKKYKVIDDSYLSDLKKIIGRNYFRFFYLVERVETIINCYLNFQDAWILEKDNDWIIGLSENGQYHLYGTSKNDELIDKCFEEMPFKKFPNNFLLVGDQDLIDKITKKASKFKIEEGINRFFYEITSERFKPLSVENIRLAKISDLDELTQMTLDFFKEEYNGKNNKDYEETKLDLIHHIIDQNYYVLETKKVLGFCSMMSTSTSNPMIGTIFIKPEFRGEKYGRNLLSCATSHILKTNKYCWLMTTQENKSSNKMVSSIGYEIKWNHSRKVIKK